MSEGIEERLAKIDVIIKNIQKDIDSMYGNIREKTKEFKEENKMIAIEIRSAVKELYEKIDGISKTANSTLIKVLFGAVLTLGASVISLAIYIYMQKP